MLVVIFHFGPLRSVDNVFQHQRVQIEMGTDGADDLGVMQTIDVDPGNGRTVLVREALLDWFDFLFADIEFIVINDAY